MFIVYLSIFNAKKVVYAFGDKTEMHWKLDYTVCDTYGNKYFKC